MHLHSTHTTPVRPPCSDHDHDQRLHIRYIDFACVAFGSDASNVAGLQRVRDIAARALDAAGLVLPNGQLLWAAARKLECALLEALESASYVSSPQPPTRALPCLTPLLHGQLARTTLFSADDDTQLSEQRERVRALYQRQLKQPLTGNDAALEEYKTWEAEHGVA